MNLMNRVVIRCEKCKMIIRCYDEEEEKKYCLECAECEIKEKIEKNEVFVHHGVCSRCKK